MLKGIGTVLNTAWDLEPGTDFEFLVLRKYLFATVAASLSFLEAVTLITLPT